MSCDKSAMALYLKTFVRICSNFMPNFMLLSRKAQCGQIFHLAAGLWLKIIDNIRDSQILILKNTLIVTQAKKHVRPLRLPRNVCGKTTRMVFNGSEITFFLQKTK